MSNKLCIGCGADKPSASFSPRQKYCKMCIAAGARAKRALAKLSGLCQSCHTNVPKPHRRTCEECLSDARLRHKLLRSYAARTGDRYGEGNTRKFRPGAWAEDCTVRKCKTCGIVKPIDQFYSQNFQRNHGRVTYRRSCIDCEAKKATERTKQYGAQGLCTRCGKSSAMEGFTRCGACREHDYNDRLHLRAAVLTAYGAKCSHCGDPRLECLEIDHVGGWGKDHVDKKGHRISGYGLWKWAKDNSYPDTLRLLCGSCHSALTHWKRLPRKLANDTLITVAPDTDASTVPPSDALSDAPITASGT